MPSSDTQFKKGNPYRMKKGHSLSNKYKKEYGDMMIEFFNDSSIYPTFELFAESIGVIHNTLLNWRDRYPHFGIAYLRCKNIQKGRTISGGMTGLYNPYIVKFMAINNFGMVEKVESDSVLHFDITLPQEIEEESD